MARIKKKSLSAIKEAFLQWVTDRREKKYFVTQWIPAVENRLATGSGIVFLVLTPEHGNLGDHAIANAEAAILQELGISYIEITERTLWKLQKNKLLSVMNGHPIFINGGGNLGTLWIGVEYIQREIMRHNPDSPICILPNTLYYEDSEWGQEEFHQSIELYNGHRELYLYAREKQSFAVMQEAYKQVKLMPDMVMSLNKCKDSENRHGCVLCLRDDCERTRSDEEDVVILQQVKQLFGEDYRNGDMRLGYNVSVEQREYELEKKYEEFREAELVVTDRLHGMVFCAITGTPCVVIDSKSPKVRGCYEWIEHLEYIKMVESAEEISAAYQSIPKKQHLYDQTRFDKIFSELKQDIQNIVKRRGK